MDARTPQPPPPGRHAAFASPSTSSLAPSSAGAHHMPPGALSSSSNLALAQPDQPVPLRVASNSNAASSNNRFVPPTAAPAPRAPMGQSSSRPDPALPSPVASPLPLPLPTTASGRLRRAWAGRRKKSEDVSAVLHNAPPRPSAELATPVSTRSFAFPGEYTYDRDNDREVPAPSYERPPSRTKLFLQSSLAVFKNKNTPQTPKSPKYSGAPPPPPPKPAQLQASNSNSKKPPVPPSTSETAGEVSSPIVTSPSISAAIHFINSISNSQDDAHFSPLPRPEGKSSADGRPSAETKQDWRRSDATMVTVRPGALAGNRSPRPVSLAESSHSGHTIVQANVGGGRRLSALIADPEFVMAEESDWEEGPSSSQSQPSSSLPSALSQPQVQSALARHPSPPSSLKARNRRSASLGGGATFALWPSAKPSAPEPFKPSVSESSAALPRVSADFVRTATARDAPTLTRAAASGYIAPGQGTEAGVRGRLAAWTAASSTATSSTSTSTPASLPASISTSTSTSTTSASNSNSSSNLSTNVYAYTPSYTSYTPASSTKPLPPPQHPRRPATAGATPGPSFRQTAVSMTGGLAPAAFGLGRRAAEKVHRVWGGWGASSGSSSHSHANQHHQHSSHSQSGSQSQSHSGCSSSSSLSLAATPSSFGSGKLCGGGGGGGRDAVGRSASGQSLASSAQLSTQSHGGWMRRTPNAPSGAWSVGSSASQSSAASADADAFVAPAGPYLGTRLRGPRKNGRGGSVVGGMLFGRELAVAVRETRIDVGAGKDGGQGKVNIEGEGSVKPLEERMLPALVVRCVQHIQRWGLEEEGLFRVSGRPSHVAKLRSEFDTGADFALTEADPGDLDPHAVASVFKAYLRELPESLLTTELVPRFEAALASATASDAEPGPTHALGGTMSLSLSTAMQSNSRGLPLLRKPPSLSTLAMPSFAGARAVSGATVRALAGLVAALPRANRDLLYTVVELVRATAAHSAETKMPLGNLLLVFCPSLGMSPPLLRVLCEVKGVWGEDGEGGEAKPARPATPEVLDIKASSSPAERRVILLDDTDSDSDLSGADMRPARRRPQGGMRRGPVAPLLQVPDLHAPYRGSGASSVSGADDAASYVSALDRPFELAVSTSLSSRTSSPADSCSAHRMRVPALTDSTDSLATPETMSEVESLQSPARENASANGNVNMKTPPMPVSVPVIASAVDADAPLPHSNANINTNTTARPRPFISAPIPFPSGTQFGVGGSPQTPSSPRKSLALLSFPPLGRSEPSSPSGPKTWSHRNKRPSLTLLFSKRSASPLASPQPPPSAISGPIHLAPTASQASLGVRDCAAFLDTPISSSPLFEKSTDRMAAGLDAPSAPVPASAATSTFTSTSSATDDARERKDSSASSLFSTPQQTPIADYFRNHSNSSLLSVAASVSAGEASPRIALRSSPSKVSLTPSIDLGIEDSVEEDWAQSVLLEAQAKSDAGRSRWSVREAVKKFEGLS
ncbi:hypothetical protein EIP86_004897 [Pleurotus ostreatoroseus]|nr:hypothetical protein EIP86_004897 [Pleurotus ostreatoroseus]